MDNTRNTAITKKELIEYIKSLGVEVNTVTKAGGNRGFYKEGRIDISRLLDDYSAVRALIHEYAHYVSSKFDKKIENLEIIFRAEDDKLRPELLKVTAYVDKNALCSALFEERAKLKKSIKELTALIRERYPHFKPNEELKEFKRYTLWSDAGYLEKYDKVKLHSWFSHKIYSISTVKSDFPNMPEVFVHYIKLRSKQRRRAKITRRISKLNKYYSDPSELFARFIEGLYIDADKVKELAPYAYERFMELYNRDYYSGLKKVFSIAGVELL